MKTRSDLSYCILALDSEGPVGLPENAAYEPVLCSDHDLWAIFRIFGRYPELPAVSTELAKLLHSAKSYPPALALTQEELLRSREPDRDKFCQEAAQLLKQHFESQPYAGYYLATPREDRDSNFLVGQFYWVLGDITGAQRGNESLVRVVCCWS